MPHAAFVNSIKKLNRDRINPAAVSQTLGTEEAIAQETVQDIGDDNDEIEPGSLLQKFKLESHRSKI